LTVGQKRRNNRCRTLTRGKQTSSASREEARTREEERGKKEQPHTFRAAGAQNKKGETHKPCWSQSGSHAALHCPSWTEGGQKGGRQKEGRKDSHALSTDRLTHFEDEATIAQKTHIAHVDTGKKRRRRRVLGAGEEDWPTGRRSGHCHQAEKGGNVGRSNSHARAILRRRKTQHSPGAHKQRRGPRSERGVNTGG